MATPAPPTPLTVPSASPPAYLFDSIVANAVKAKEHLAANNVEQTFSLLHAIVHAIELLDEVRQKIKHLNLPPHICSSVIANAGAPEQDGTAGLEQPSGGASLQRKRSRTSSPRTGLLQRTRSQNSKHPTPGSLLEARRRNGTLAATSTPASLSVTTNPASMITAAAVTSPATSVADQLPPTPETHFAPDLGSSFPNDMTAHLSRMLQDVPVTIDLASLNFDFGSWIPSELTSPLLSPQALATTTPSVEPSSAGIPLLSPFLAADPSGFASAGINNSGLTVQPPPPPPPPMTPGMRARTMSYKPSAPMADFSLPRSASTHAAFAMPKGSPLALAHDAGLPQQSTPGFCADLRAVDQAAQAMTLDQMQMFFENTQDLDMVFADAMPQITSPFATAPQFQGLMANGAGAGLGHPASSPAELAAAPAPAPSGGFFSLPAPVTPQFTAMPAPTFGSGLNGQVTTQHLPDNNTTVTHHSIPASFTLPSPAALMSLVNQVPSTQIQQHTMGSWSSYIAPELIARIDVLFFWFLQELCSNSEATDSRGEAIHQTLMAKRLEKRMPAGTPAAAAAAAASSSSSPGADMTPPMLASSAPGANENFYQISFRIQPFTNTFSELLLHSGLLCTSGSSGSSGHTSSLGSAASRDQQLPARKIKTYLWNNRFIRRYNEDGRKSKSKGSHVWSVLARRDYARECWEFRPFERKIFGAVPAPLVPGVPWSWEPKVWDPQVKAPKATWESAWLPEWMVWQDGVLIASPPTQLAPEVFEIEITARYQHGDTKLDIQKSVELEIVALSPSTLNRPQLTVTSATAAAVAAAAASSLSVLQPLANPAFTSTLEEDGMSPFLQSTDF
ncbi:hypothetical protein RI367_003183 [Sorochytrium milnesiophthora]